MTFPLACSVPQADPDAGAPPTTLEPIQGAVAEAPVRSAKGTTRDKIVWLEGVLADRGINPTTFVVAFVVAQHLNNRTGEAWPKQARIARVAGVSETTARACLRTLITRGHLQPGKKGARNSNKYRLSRAAGGADVD